MRGIYDGPTTGRHSILGGSKTSRAKSLDIPRRPYEAGAGESGLGSAPTLPQDDHHAQLRLATQTAPRDIPGAGAARPAKQPPANLGMLLHVLSRRPYQQSSGAASGLASPTSELSSQGSSLQADQDLLMSSPKTL